MQLISGRVPARKQNYDIHIGARTLAALGIEARRGAWPGARREALISNRKVFDLFGEKSCARFRSSGFDCSVWLMKDGEQHKSMRSLEQALTFSANPDGTNDAVIALGRRSRRRSRGFAAATYLRGVAFINVPTTLLAKSMLRLAARPHQHGRGKNLVGCFSINHVWS